MDTTREYIKKCEKAEEIQARYRLKDGDIYAQFHAGKYESRLYHEATGGLRWVSLKAIWLPTQDRLQEMVSPKKDGKPKLMGWMIVAFYKFVFPQEPRIGEQYNLLFSSMEQAWLAFVMHEKFGKVWDSEKEEWVKEK